MPETVIAPHQSKELIYALDIGTRSVIGLLATRDGDKVHILAMEKLLHTHRVMMDGQIEDIAQVAAAVRTVTDRLEQAAGCKLERACVAAAGRALRTQKGCAMQELAVPEPVTEAMVAQLEAAAVAQAEQSISGDVSGEQQLLLVGYTTTQYRLDGYPLSTLVGHTARRLEADVVATFLPSGVIDSLYAALRQAELEVASLTLEPIAALNAAIPADLRLLNLCLVDIGAGTSDIAVCRDGGVVGYTMATVAGDEMTEVLMREYLVDYSTAENMKVEMADTDTLSFTDILGQDQTCTTQQAQAVLAPSVELLAQEIAQRVIELNGSAPSALFLAGGGSKLSGLQEQVAAALGMEPRRVSVAGGHFKTTAYSHVVALDDPEFTTPLGIAVSAGLGLINDSCQVTLNGTRAKLFRSGDLSVMDLLMMNGYSYFHLLGKTGKPLILQVDGKRRVFYGDPPKPAQLRINGVDAQPSSLIHAGDQVEFVPAQGGNDCRMTVQQLSQQLHASSLTINGTVLNPEDEVPNNAFVVLSQEENSMLPPSLSETAKATDPSLSTSSYQAQPTDSTLATPTSPPHHLGTYSSVSSGLPVHTTSPSDNPAATADLTAAPSVVTVTPILDTATQTTAATTPTVDTTAQPTVTSTKATVAQSVSAQTPEPPGVSPSFSTTATSQMEEIPPPAHRPSLKLFLNGQAITLPPKHDGAPYYVMDLLERTGIDFKHIQHPVILRLNGVDCQFQQILKNGDQVNIGYEDEVISQ